jgi:hypothetical protein
MRKNGRRWLISRICLSGSALLLFAGLAKGQESAGDAPTNESSAELRSEVHELATIVRALQSQVQSLNSQLTELRGKDQDKESKDQGGSLASGNGAQTGTRLQKDPSIVGVSDQYSTFPAGSSPSNTSRLASGSLDASPQADSSSQSLEGRIAKLEDDRDLIDAKLEDQYQTKVESGSKYRLRLSGIVLVNLFENRGPVDNADFPEIATGPSPVESDAIFGGSLRQSQIKLEAFGPDLLGARTSAHIDFDFAGGFPNAPNGEVLNTPRLRTGTVRLDWTNTSIVAGQDFLFFAPLEPTSIATVAIPPLSYSGNLWAWTPQVRIEHRMKLSETSNLLFEAGILDSLSGDFPATQYDRYPSWGEQSGQPAYAGRLAWSHRAFGREIKLGGGMYYGRQFWALDRHVNGWAVTTDLTLPLGTLFTFSGEFYRGSGLGGLGGGVGQDIVLSGAFMDPATLIEGVNSMGGWAQMKFKPRANFEINAAVGQDNPFASEIRKYSATTPPVYGDLIVKNQSAFVNFIFQPRSDLMLSIEYRRLHTFVIDDSYDANQVNLGMGYIF